MFLASDPLPKELHPYATLMIPALITLVPAIITAGYKALQDHSRDRRSGDLTERICKLTKDISELPELKSGEGEIPLAPRLALIAELNAAIAEITTMRARPAHRAGNVSISLWANVRSALLLYRPKGLLAFMLHTTFYVYSLVVLGVLIVMVTDRTPPRIIELHPWSTFLGDLLLLAVMTGIFSLPAVFMRNAAARIRRKQNADVQMAAASPAPDVMPASAVSPGD